MNRARLASYVKGKTVLDLFSYVGGWAIPAAKYGATHVTAIDSSELATQFLAKNATKNGVQDQMEILTEDVFKALEKLIAEGKTFDVIVADPPAFIKKKADLKPGIQGYTKLHQLCLKLLKKEGILISASCSLHLSGEELLNIIRQTSVSAVRKTRVLEQLHQGPDHPLHPSIKETAYLKGFVSVVG
jgi:23S rRNA (cytosine1962-C5)-methyltransferase